MNSQEAIKIAKSLEIEMTSLPSARDAETYHEMRLAKAQLGSFFAECVSNDHEEAVKTCLRAIDRLRFKMREYENLDPIKLFNDNIRNMKAK